MMARRLKNGWTVFGANGAKSWRIQGPDGTPMSVMLWGREQFGKLTSVYRRDRAAGLSVSSHYARQDKTMRWGRWPQGTGIFEDRAYAMFVVFHPTDVALLMMFADVQWYSSEDKVFP